MEEETFSRPKRSNEGPQGGRGRSPNDEERDVADLPQEMPRASDDIIQQRKVLRVRRPESATTPGGVIGGTFNPFSAFGQKAAAPSPSSVTSPPSSLVKSPVKTDVQSPVSKASVASPAKNPEEKPKAFSYSFAALEKTESTTSTEEKPKAFSFSLAAEVQSEKRVDKEREALQSASTAAIPLTGEEEESTKYLCQVKAYTTSAESKQWVDLGCGEFKVNLAKNSVSARVLMREEKTRRVIINFPLGSSFLLGTMLETQEEFKFVAQTPEGCKKFLVKQPKSMTKGTLTELYKTLKQYQEEMTK